MTTIDISPLDRVRLATESLKSILSESLGRRCKTKKARLEFEARKQDGPLSIDQLRAITENQVHKVGKDHRARWTPISSNPEPERNWPMQRRGATILEHLLADSPDVRSIANIGARVDFTCSYLPPQISRKEFHQCRFSA